MQFHGLTDSVNSVCLSPDGRHALSGSRDKTLKLWDVASGSCLRTFKGDEWVSSSCLSAEGRYVLVDKGFSLYMQNVESNSYYEFFGRYKKKSGVCSVCVSADGQYVAFVSLATDLVPGDTNGAPDAFYRDTVLNRTVRVSVSTAGEQATGKGGVLSLSADGRYVAFVSSACNLAGEASATYRNIYARGVLSEAVPYTLAEAAAALAVAGGLGRPVDFPRLNVDKPGGGRVDLLDAVRIARKVAGLEGNP